MRDVLLGLLLLGKGLIAAARGDLMTQCEEQDRLQNLLLHSFPPTVAFLMECCTVTQHMHSSNNMSTVLTDVSAVGR